jgi:hypothetical protein
VGRAALSSKLAEVFLGELASGGSLAIKTADDVGRFAVGKKNEAACCAAHLEDLRSNLHGHVLIRGNVIEEIETARKRTRDWLEYELGVPVGRSEYAIHEVERNLVLHAGD